MLLCIGVVATWVLCVAGGLTYQRLFKANSESIKVFNVSDREIRHKSYQASISERSKGFKR